MNIFGDINIITAVIAVIFVIPILIGIVRPLTNERIHRSFASLLNNLILLASILLSIYLTRIILSDADNIVLTTVYKIFPALESAANAQIWVSVILTVVLALLIDGLLYLITLPVRLYAVPPLSKGISSAVKSMGGFFRRVIGGLWQLPRSVWLVLLFSILLNFYTGLFNSPVITQYANTSAPYQFVQESVIQPLQGSSVVKNVQVIFNDSFKFAENQITGESDTQLIKYFNGVKLEDAIQSNADIDAQAQAIVGTETDEKQKAYLLYLWICQNVTYDNGKAEKLGNGTAGVSSGAVIAYTTRSGVCFDYACLYIAMCRAVDVKVRFLTGLGYTGSDWGDHAWNQVDTQNGWINVDTTFGSSGINYFDRPHFYLDHKDAVVQGEW